jgi:formate-dependent nitrite reductase membrane component NrfD
MSGEHVVRKRRRETRKVGEFDLQTRWGWLITASLFFEGSGAGLFFVSFVGSLTFGISVSYLDWGVLTGPILGAIGVMFLFMELGHKERFLHVFSNLKESWLSRGALFDTLFIIFAIIYYILPAQSSWSDLRLVVGVIGAVGAFLVMLYTGLVQSAIPGIPFWNSPALPMLSLSYSLMSGVGGTFVIAWAWGCRTCEAPDYLGSFAIAEALLIVLSLTILSAYLIVSRSSRVEAKASANYLVKGRLAWLFWLGIVLVGFIVPLLLASYSGMQFLTREPVTPATVSLLFLAGLMVYVGYLLLRYVLISSGIHALLEPTLWGKAAK